MFTAEARSNTDLKDNNDEKSKRGAKRKERMKIMDLKGILPVNNN